MCGLDIAARVKFFAFAIFLYFIHVMCIGNASSVLNFSDVSCGKHRHHQHHQQSLKRGRIVGGVEARPGEFPWIVSIRHRGSHTCAGVVVNNKWIVTAAHCFCSGSSIESKNEFDVIVNRNGFRNVSSQSLYIKGRIIHPGYNCSKLENDIALLELFIEISWLNADPACFPMEGAYSYTNLASGKATAVGWGATNEDLSLGSIPWVLHKVQVPILKNEECELWYESQNKTLRLRKSQMCAGYKSGHKDTCWADSGGPLMVENGTRMVVVGLVSTGIGCARASLPGIYTRLSEYVEWIRHAVLPTTEVK